MNFKIWLNVLLTRLFYLNCDDCEIFSSNVFISIYWFQNLLKLLPLSLSFDHYFLKKLLKTRTESDSIFFDNILILPGRIVKKFHINKSSFLFRYLHSFEFDKKNFKQDSFTQPNPPDRRQSAVQRTTFISEASHLSEIGQGIVAWIAFWEGIPVLKAKVISNSCGTSQVVTNRFVSESCEKATWSRMQFLNITAHFGIELDKMSHRSS